MTISTKSRFVSRQVLGTKIYLVLIVLAAIILILLQQKYWHGENGRASLAQLREDIAKQERQNMEQARLNELLRADVNDLKTQPFAIEEHARLDLGLVKSGETFYQLSNTPADNVIATPVESNEPDALEPTDGLIQESPQ